VENHHVIIDYKVTYLPTIVRILQYLALSKFRGIYEGWNFNSNNYLFTTDTK